MIKKLYYKFLKVSTGHLISSFIVIFIVLNGNSVGIAGSFSRVEILREDSVKYSIQDVTSRKLNFRPYVKGNYVRIKKSYWLRFTYSAADIQEISYLFGPYILYQQLDLYYKIGDSLYHYQSGVNLEFERRNLFLPTLNLQLPNALENVQCWLHVDGFYSDSFVLLQRTNKQLVAEDMKLVMEEYFLIGLGFLACLFSLAFYFFLWDRLYLYYGLFSFMLLLSRLTHSGFIFYYLNSFIDFTTLKSIYNLYALTYGGINIALLFYFHEFLKTYKPFKYYDKIIFWLAAVRAISLVIHLNIENPTLEPWVDSRILDLFIQFFLLTCIIKTARKNYRQSILAFCSIIILITGNLLYIVPQWLAVDLSINAFNLFLNLSAVEVILFAMAMAYRTHYLKLEHDKAVEKVVENLQASEALKDELNKQLEQKVEERTAQITRMNELLKAHNIKLETEVNNANEARVFQQVMGFNEFKKIFPDDNICYQYLAKLKWKSKADERCKKCSYDNYTTLENLSRRCGKCGYIESVTNGTLFQRLKFPIIKAFYITYRTSIGAKSETTLAEMAEEIDLRQATLWTFRQKVIGLMEANISKKKHKDGWTHLIEHSIVLGKVEN